VGLSILGISHRSDWFKELVLQTEQQIKSLLGIGSDYHVLFLQGGATQQFSMVPMAFLQAPSASADYLVTGYWSQKAATDARQHGSVRLVWEGQSTAYSRLPRPDELDFNPQAAYLHYISNETVEGLQQHQMLGLDGVPRVCDMSSDFLAHPIEAQRFDLIYAHAQKNLGPAGVTVVVLRDECLQKAQRNLPDFLNYHTQVEAHSNFNTPPVFAIYVVHLVLRWLQDEVGGLAPMGQINQAKAQALYEVIYRSQGFYQGRANPADRSRMNVCFRLPHPALEAQFLAQAQAAGFSGLAGHRSTGGLRASLYNGVTLTATQTLASFMREFFQKMA
jgi:phosphoserine aminotransferase